MLKTELYTRLTVNGGQQAPITAWLDHDDKVPKMLEEILAVYRLRTQYGPATIACIEKHFQVILGEVTNYTARQLRMRRTLSLDILARCGEEACSGVSVEYFVWDVNAYRIDEI